MIDRFLENKGALITGAASGFGKGTAEEFAKKGADLVLVDINEELLEETTKEIRHGTSQKVIPIVCDVSKSDQVQAMTKQAFKELGNVYILFNNAGIAGIFGPDLLRIKEDMFDKILNVNLRGQWLVSKYACKQMKRQKFEPLAGKVIHTASIAGMVVDNKICVYSLSKVGVIAMTRMLAQSLAPKITVNSISPGIHPTGIYMNSEETALFKIEEGNVKTPLNRLGTVDDVVKVVSFLASPGSNFITGHCFPVDGGIAEVGVPPNYLIT